MSSRSVKKGKQKRGSAANASSGPVFRLEENPFAKVPPDKLAEGLKEAGQNFAKEFEKLFDNLQKQVNSFQPLHLLSVLSVYGLFAGMTEKGKTKEKDSSLLQPHVEIVQALALRNPLDLLAKDPARPEQMQEIWDLLEPLSQAFDFKRLVQVKESNNEEQRSLLYLQERLRAHTQMVRNWGYYKRVIRICRKLFSPLDSLYERQIGIGATSIIGIFEHLVDNSERCVNQHYQRLKSVRRCKSIEEAVRGYYKVFPALDGTPEELIAFFQKNNFSAESVFSVILSHSELRLQDFFTFSAEEMSKEKGLSLNGLSRALSSLSFAFGDLNSSNLEHLFLGNPVWLKPLIRIDEDTYFCSIPQMFFSFAFPILSGLIEGNGRALDEYYRRRSSFLEAEAFNIIHNGFRSREYVRKFKWHEGKAEYETDLLYKVDSYLIIVEAKSGAISLPALRGAPERMRRHIKELFIDPASQSRRFEEKLLRIKSEGKDSDPILSDLPFDIAKIHKILRLSITLDDFATIQSNVRSLSSTGWLPDDFVPAPTILISDLEIIFEILDSTPEKLHYLIRRSEHERDLEYLGDELDLLGLYLETGFNLGGIEYSGNKMVLVKMSKPIDEYYIALDQGIRRKKPKLKSTKWWKDIFSHLERRDVQRWSEISVMLLNIPFDDQVQAKIKFNSVIRNVKRKWREEGHINSVAIYPPDGRDSVSLLAFREQNKDRRYEFMTNLASRTFEESKASRCIVIGVNIDKSDYPYSVLGVFDRPADD
ncbi:MAG: hypothetical protein C4576_25515 [Desulfobacteraceae bacterium]|nr:MAG: hypothetical protein C4576_25515 [Desulfobacteraceae bacterium]